MIKKLIKKNYIHLIAIIILIIAFMLLFKINYCSKYIYQLDNNIIDSILKIRNPFATNILIVMTNLGDWYVPLIILILLLVISDDNRKCFSLTICYLASVFIAFLPKILIGRPRPELSMIKTPDKFSFPSGHTLTSIVFYIMLWYIIFYKKKGFDKTVSLMFFILIILFIGFSRIYLGVHYFFDVIGAVLFSIPCVLISKNIVKKFMG